MDGAVRCEREAMNNIYCEDRLVPGSLCDWEGKVGLFGAVSWFMDLAGSHADELGCGLDEMKARGLFWLTVRTRLRFYSPARMYHPVHLTTWPEKPGTVRCFRSYRMEENGSTLIEGQTEWAVYDFNLSKVVPCAGVFPAELDFRPESAMEGRFARIAEDFSNGEELGRYCVSSSDIDMGGHMNNAAYIRAVMGFLPVEELKAVELREAEISFRAQCYEGETLRICRRGTDTGCELAALREDGKPALLVKLVY